MAARGPRAGNPHAPAKTNTRRLLRAGNTRLEAREPNAVRIVQLESVAKDPPEACVRHGVTEPALDVCGSGASHARCGHRAERDPVVFQLVGTCHSIATVRSRHTSPRLEDEICLTTRLRKRNWLAFELCRSPVRILERQR